MGLEGVEIVMSVEEAFDITLPNAETEKLVTPRDLIELVMTKIRKSDTAACMTQNAFHRLRRSVMSELNIQRANFRLETSMDQLLPAATRKMILRKIYQKAGVASPPKLIRSGLGDGLLLLSSIGIGVGTGVAFSRAHSGISVLAWLAGFAVGAFALRLGGHLTREMKNTFPQSLRTVRGHVGWIVANAPPSIATPPGQWSREQVSEKVREIVIDQLACDNYREDAQFVQDLGMN
jgi:acyl carrier protein